MSHDTLRRLVSDAYNTQSAGMTVGLPRVKVDASQLRALIAHYDSLIAERDTLRAEVERLNALLDVATKMHDRLMDERNKLREELAETNAMFRQR